MLRRSRNRSYSASNSDGCSNGDFGEKCRLVVDWCGVQVFKCRKRGCALKDEAKIENVEYFRCASADDFGDEIFGVDVRALDRRC